MKTGRHMWGQRPGQPGDFMIRSRKSRVHFKVVHRIKKSKFFSSLKKYEKKENNNSIA